MIFELSAYFSVWLVEVLLGFILMNGFFKIASARSAQQIVFPLRFGLLFAALIFSLLTFALRRSYFEMPTLEGFPKIYFAQTFLFVRLVLDFTVWTLLVYFLKKPTKIMGPISLIVVLFTGTQFSVDWIIAYTPHWSSSGFGLIFLVSSLLTAFSMALLKSNLQFEKKVLNDLGLIHFTMIAAWSYLNFMQFLVMWSGNLPSQATWYILRLQTDWRFLSIFLLIFQMILPLFLLLFKRLKHSVKGMKILAVFTFVNQVLFTFLMIAPSLRSEGPIYSLKLLIFIILTVAAACIFSLEKTNEPAR